MDVIVLKGIKIFVPLIPIVLYASEKEDVIKREIYMASILSVISVNIYSYITTYIDDYEEDVEYDQNYH